MSLSLVKFLCLPDLFEHLMASPTNWPPRERLSSRQCLPIPTTKDFIKLHLRWNLYDISFPWFDGQLIYFHPSQRYTPAPIRHFLPIFRLYNPEYNQMYNSALYLFKILKLHNPMYNPVLIFSDYIILCLQPGSSCSILPTVLRPSLMHQTIH